MRGEESTYLKDALVMALASEEAPWKRYGFAFLGCQGAQGG